jgi:hypothetical protein
MILNQNILKLLKRIQNPIKIIKEPTIIGQNHPGTNQAIMGLI